MPKHFYDTSMPFDAEWHATALRIRYGCPVGPISDEAIKCLSWGVSAFRPPYKHYLELLEALGLEEYESEMGAIFLRNK